MDPNVALADAEALYRAGEARLGTNEDIIIHILTTRSPSQLNMTLQYYRQNFGRDFEKVDGTNYFHELSIVEVDFWRSVYLVRVSCSCSDLNLAWYYYNRACHSWACRRRDFQRRVPKLF